MSNDPLSVLTPAQTALLTSPLRVEIIDSLLAQGPASVSELTVRLHAPAKTLYYHMHQLQKADLVRVREVREVGKRTESVYETRRMRLQIDPSGDAANAEHTIRWMGAVLRLIGREHERAVRAMSENHPPAGPLLALRHVYQLEKEARGQFLALLKQARQFAQEHHTPGRGTLLSFSAFVVPLQPRSDLTDTETGSSSEKAPR